MKFTIAGGSARTDIVRPASGLCEALSKVPTSILSDCLERMNCVSSEIRPTGSFGPFAGPAFTIEEIEAGNLMSHLALKYIQPGDVLVINGRGVTSRSCWGGLQTFAALKKGAAAVLVDGAVRDLEDIDKYGLPVYARGVTPAGPHKGWGGRMNETVSFGEVPVSPGDIVVGDRDGLVVVPSGRASQIVEAAAAKMDLERAWFEAVERGEDTADFLGFMDLARKYNITFTSSDD